MTEEMKIKWRKDLEAVILEDLGSPTMTVADIAKKMHLSERNFYRRTKMCTGVTPNTFIRELSLKKSHELINSGEFEKVKDVAHAVGFSKVSYFTKLFKDKYGINASALLKDEMGGRYTEAN